MALCTTPAAAASLTLQWDPPSDDTAVGYIIYYGLGSGALTQSRDVGAATVHEVSGLAEQTTYCFVVRAYNSSGALGEASSQVCGTTDAAPVPPPPPPTSEPPSEPPQDETGDETNETNPSGTPDDGEETPADDPEDASEPVTMTVTTAAEFQAALDAARPGDTILLAEGNTFSGNFVLPFKEGHNDDYIVIRSSTRIDRLPPAGTRITTNYTKRLAQLRSPNAEPILRTAPGAHHYRVEALELRANKVMREIVVLGDGSAAQSDAERPHHIILDRLLVRTTNGTDAQRAITLNSASTAVINSHIAGFVSGGEGEAIGGWNGPGPFVIENNYLESAGANVTIGAQPADKPGVTATDVTIVRNHFSKLAEWKSLPGKGLLELRNATDVEIDGNVFENSWSAEHFAIAFDGVQRPGTPAGVVSDVQFTNNVVRGVGNAIFIASDRNVVPRNARRITVGNNVFYDVSVNHGGAGLWLHIEGGEDVTLDHNMVVTDGAVAVRPSGDANRRMVITNNTVVHGGNAIKSQDKNAGSKTLVKYFPYIELVGNVFVGDNPKAYPAANYFPTTVDAVGFVDFLGGDYRLGTNSIFLGGASDGKDPGVDVTALSAAQQ